ncbi:putative signal recognition particle receptor subunit beta [Blattamonas nauphoetae]|uniref:Signal recognition particle receptor subunit beta n=1 Tax=Blattamonas nauphoetae TaxID=2049346 RepID=A0ABQ9YMJ6_9EUKA|nr:putative signal recognition particle receptor subunit beta [Blattamonas nauphoetae]
MSNLVNQILSQCPFVEIPIGQYSFPISTPIILALLTILLIITCPCWGRKRTAKATPTIGIIGLTGSGKTALFYTLKEGTTPETFMSEKENSAIFDLSRWTKKKNSNKKYQYIDFPGAENTRQKFFNHPDFANIRKLIYLVDSTTFKNDVAKIGKFFYSILTSPTLVKKKTPIMIAFNKQDLLHLKNSDDDSDDSESEPDKPGEQNRRITNNIVSLEKEINKIRTDKASVTRDLSDAVPIADDQKKKSFFSFFSRSKSSPQSGKVDTIDCYVTSTIGEEFSLRSAECRIDWCECCVIHESFEPLIDFLCSR